MTSWRKVLVRWLPIMTTWRKDKQSWMLRQARTHSWQWLFRNLCFLPNFSTFGQTVSERKNIKNQPIRYKNRLWRPCLLTGRDEMSNLYRSSPIHESYQVSDHLIKRFLRRRFFRNRPIRNKNCLWQLCLLTDRYEMSNLYRGPAIDASYQVSVHLAKQFQSRIFLKIG